MYKDNTSTRPWRDIARELVKEPNGSRVYKLAEELNNALEVERRGGARAPINATMPSTNGLKQTNAKFRPDSYDD